MSRRKYEIVMFIMILAVLTTTIVDTIVLKVPATAGFLGTITTLIAALSQADKKERK